MASTNIFTFNGDRQIAVSGNLNNTNTNLFNFGGGGGGGGRSRRRPSGMLMATMQMVSLPRVHSDSIIAIAGVKI